MSVAVDANVSNFDRVGPDIANQSGSHEKSIAVVLNPATIIVVKRTRLNCVALANKILTKQIRNIDVLPAVVESVQSAVRIFLELCKVGSVDLVTIVAELTEDARAQVVVGKDEAAKV